MFYITSSGRVVNDSTLIGNEEYLEREAYPKAPIQTGKIGVITGIDKTQNSVIYTYFDEITEPTNNITPYEPTNAEIAQLISDLQADILIAQGGVK